MVHTHDLHTYSIYCDLHAPCIDSVIYYIIIYSRFVKNHVKHLMEMTKLLSAGQIHFLEGHIWPSSKGTACLPLVLSMGFLLLFEDEQSSLNMLMHIKKLCRTATAVR